MRITIEVGPLEAALFEDQHDELQAALVRDGHHVHVEAAPEYRGGLPTQDLVDVALYLGEEASDVAVEAILVLVGLKLRGLLRIGRGQERQPVVRIFGPGGRVLRQVRVEADEADAAT